MSFEARGPTTGLATNFVTQPAAASLCSLAQMYKAQGRLGDSVSLHEESLAMKRRIHGSKDHSEVAASLHSLALVYKAQGRLDDSASLQEESLAMARRIHGSRDLERRATAHRHTQWREG